MKKILLVAVGAAALTASACGFAQAQNGADDRGARHGVFASDADSDGVLTRAEFNAGREAQFARLDGDNNGQLTREEMRAERGERRRGRGGHRGAGLTRADTDNDGNITREEFLARPTAMFARLDANSDGVISAAERPQRPERASNEGSRRNRGDRPNPDTNGDGSFSRAEFTAMGAAMFERLDANNDGRVTQEEARAQRGHRRGRGRD
jgi:Ca2+-binding EF-hand superfamily protein